MVSVMSWVKAWNGNAKANSLVAGHDVTGEPLYVARAVYEGDLINGKLVSLNKRTFASWGGKEYFTNVFEVLVKSTNQWLSARGGYVPSNALQAGRTKSGETLYIGRVHHLNSLTPENVHPSHGACYIPFGEEELKFTDYEVLLAN